MRRKSWHSLSEYQALRAMMERSTTASAARRLGQSAVSRALSNLEARVGTTLFERDAGRLVPTAAAHDLNMRLDALFDALDAIDGPTASGQEELRLIAPPSFVNRFLVEHIATFRKASPEVLVSLEIATSEDVIAGLLEGRFDLGVTGVERSRAGVKLIPFRRSRVTCVMACDHPLSALSTVSPQDLDGRNLIAFNYRHARRAQLEKLLHETEARPNVVVEVSTTDAAIELAALGVGVAIVNPFPGARNPGGQVVFRPFSAPISYQTYFSLADQRPISRAASRFMRHLRLNTPNDAFSEPA